ncbi:solute carrier family 2, facilitated glucose transporter member 8-like isoform X2 [Coccinella septempunctata]|uniref:solute carrier family 2, facilitated glucose transporter member 8-like isoform X2 n=1 Tax=Coccinella septempunctata TaxID=41139 RepID=UPI001D067F51|nr:solute carrier family 2, facilitated glucose transporter member 8-like isoform X2 [Coccinella septempunctata]
MMNDDPEDRLSDEKEPVFTQSQDRVVALSWKDSFRQIIAACISFSIVIQVGANMSFSSILVPQLAEKDSPIHITRSDASWIASIVAIALPMGALIVGPLMDVYGRKKISILISAPFVVAWIFQIYATDLWHIYIARVISGFTGGLTTAAIVYISEISHPSLRQALLSLNSVFVSLGVLLTYLFGTILRWRITAMLLCAGSILSGVGMMFLPESPYWCLIFKNDYGGAQKALRALFKNHEVFDSQYHHLLLVKRKAMNRSDGNETRLQKLKEEVRLITHKTVYKPTVILFLIFFAQQITGGYVIIFYATDIFRKLDGQSQNQGMTEMASLVLLGVIRFLASGVSFLVSKNFGRRSILMTSGVGMAFCSFVAGVYIYFTVLSNEQIEAMNLTTSDKTYNIAFLFVLGYVAFGSLGFLVIPWTLIGELLPVKVRGLIGGVLVSLAYVMMFFFVKIFPAILDSIDIHSIFCVVSILNLVSVMFIYFFLPETLGRNFSEIEGYFER